MMGVGGQHHRYALAAVLMLAACEEEAGLVSVQPELEVVPEAGTLLEFEDVVLGISGPAAPRIVDIYNVGDGVLDLRNAEVRGEGADQFRISSFPDQLPPGGEGEMFVRFEPTLTGTITAEVVLETSDLDEREVSWPVRGYARDPCQLRVEPAHQVFTLGETRTVQLTSSSTYECVITALETDLALFTFVDPPPMPFTIGPGASIDLQVQHSGTTVQPGIPVRQLRVREAEGTERVVSFEGEPPIYGCLDIGPTRLDFGTVPINTFRDRTVSIRNRCSEPATVVSAAVGDGYYAYSVLEAEEGTLPIILGAREQTTLTVRYRPLLETGDGGRMTIITNDSALPRFRVELRGDAARGIVEVFPRNLEFGTVAYRPLPVGNRSECSSATEVVQVYNTGLAPVTVSRIAIENVPDELFQISAVTVEGAPVDYTQPFSIPVRGEVRVSVVFTPTRLNPSTHEGRLVIAHDARSQEDEVRLVGEAGDDGAVEERFRQLPGPKVDILWVIDNSCSMIDEQARLISNLSRFVGFAELQNSDYQMAVTDTDGTSPNSGRLERCFPHPAIVGSAYADRATREAAFRCMFDVGINGGGEEAGWGAAKSVFERALDPTLDPNPNAPFLRDDASLVVVAVSDEDDQSFEPGPVLRDFFFSIKGSRNPERFTAHAIAYPVEEPCVPEQIFASPGFEYSWMTRQTGGLFFNLCNEDWSPILQQIAQTTFVLLDEWELSRQADPATLFVRVDGVPVRQDPTSGWTYDLVGNTIQFHGSAVPDRGAEIVVSYQGLCRP